jgi:hypothetical protein
MDLHDDMYNWLTAMLQHIYQKLNFTIQKNDDEIKHSQAQMKVEMNEMKDKITGMEKKQEKIKVR